MIIFSSIKKTKLSNSFDVERTFFAANKFDHEWISFRIKQVKRQSTGYIRP